MFIDYHSAIYDHFCVFFSVEVSITANENMMCNEEFIEKMVGWDKLSDVDKLAIGNKMDDIILNSGVLCHTVFSCNKINCQDHVHRKSIDEIFDVLVNVLLVATEDFAVVKRCRYRIVPGWNDYVKGFYDTARKHFLAWKSKGKPPDGQYLDDMKISRSRFRDAFQNCKVNEDQIRRTNMLSNLKNKNHKEFWKDVYRIKRNNVKPKAIDGKTDPELVCRMFSDRFREVFAKQKSQSLSVVDDFTGKEFTNIDWSFSKSDIGEAIGLLKCSIGMDGIHSNHLKFCTELVRELISTLYGCFVTHHYVPMNLIKGMITPTVKDTLGDLSSSSNYRPVMSSSVLLRLFEYCLLKRITPYIELNDRQHGFRQNYSTVTACLTLKETVINYNKANSDVYACFIDVSKAFDTVNHNILMRKLLNCGVPEVYVNVINYWYKNQMVRVKHMSCLSDEWLICNGVRQGGVLSGLFFSLYIDSLLDEVSKSKYGCKLGIHKANIIAYADDIVLLAPSAKGLQLLIDIAASQAGELKLSFNKEKSKWMIFRNSKSKTLHVELAPMNICKEPIEMVTQFKYLGIVLKDTLSNCGDIQRALSKFYCEFNNILRKFHFADYNVKLHLFRHYCLQIYGSDLWFYNVGVIGHLKHFAIGYHKAIKKILGLSTHESNHYACQEAELLTFKHLLNKIRIITAIRLFSSPCNYFRKILYFLNVSSVFLNEIKTIALTEYDIESLFENDRDAIMSRIVYVQNREETLR